MPDPLLVTSRLDKDFAQAVATARRFGVKVSREGEFVFLQCRGTAGQPNLARIDCRGYPLEPADVQFLPPDSPANANARPSGDMQHWPQNPSPMNRGGQLTLCLAGTKSYRDLHPDPGYVLPLSQLVATLAMWCRGDANMTYRRMRR